MEAENRNEISHFLRLAEAEGWNWVAFDHDPGRYPQTYVFHGFESAAQAEEFCNDNNLAFDVYQQDLETANYRYMPVDNLWAAAQDLKQAPVNGISVSTVAEQLRRDGVQLLPGQDMETLKPFLEQELIFPVQWTKMIDPVEETDRFHVVAHHHPGHQVYEMGHSTRIVDSFPMLAAATECFKGLIRQYTDNSDKNDYLLIGQYKGRELKLDMEGWPESYCGLTLRTAHYQYDPELKEKVWNIQEIHSLDEPKSIRHFLYARLDRNTGTLRLYNDRLQKTRPEDLRVSTYPGQLINEKLTIKNVNIMNEKNFDYLKNQVKFLGFGEGLEKELGEMIQTGQPSFKLDHQVRYNNDDVLSTLHFQKSKESDLYFFNSFDMAYKPTGHDEVLKQTYFVGKENNLTLKEHYNMLEGRAVYKEFNKLEQTGEGDKVRFRATDETYNAWTQLNFKQTDDNGNFPARKLFGFDLEKTLAKYPIKELDDNYDKSRLIASLEKGNLPKATLAEDGKDQKILIAANPIDKGLKFYDSNMQRLEVKQIQVQKQELGEGLAQGENNTVQQENKKESQKQDATGENKQNKAERKRQQMKVS